MENEKFWIVETCKNVLEMAKSDPSFLDSGVSVDRCGILNTAHKVLSGVHCRVNQQKIWFQKSKTN